MQFSAPDSEQGPNRSDTAGLSLVLGGARSGKSAFAEHLVHLSGKHKVYLATSEALDGEMADRIAHHRERRGDDWTLFEEPLDLIRALDHSANPRSIVLVDCLTLWLTNLMVAGRDVDDEADALTRFLPHIPKGARVVFVSNEVGQGIVPMDKMARDFRDHAGRLHQKLAQQVDHVWFVTAGLPQKLK